MDQPGLGGVLPTDWVSWMPDSLGIWRTLPRQLDVAGGVLSCPQTLTNWMARRDTIETKISLTVARGDTL